MPFIPAVVGAALIGGGAGIGSTLISKSGAKGIANQQQQLAQQAQARSQPAFDSALKYYQDIMQNPLKSPGFTDTAMQFDQARKNVISGAMNRGGGLDAGLANVETGRATAISNLLAGGRANAAAGLSNLASGNQNAALAALAGSQQTQATNAMMQQQALGGIGSFLMRLISNPSFTGMFGGGSGFSPTPNGKGGYNSIIGNIGTSPAAVVNPQEFNYMPTARG